MQRRLKKLSSAHVSRIGGAANFRTMPCTNKMRFNFLRFLRVTISLRVHNRCTIIHRQKNDGCMKNTFLHIPFDVMLAECDPNPSSTTQAPYKVSLISPRNAMRFKSQQTENVPRNEECPVERLTNDQRLVLLKTRNRKRYARKFFLFISTSRQTRCSD